MPISKPTLHMMCGNIASGKSTLTARLASHPNTIVTAEDAWLHQLYGDQLQTPADFMRCAALLRQVIAPHVISLLQAGVSVVLDFQANTVKSRAWMKTILDQCDADHTLHVLDVPAAVCAARLRARNAKGDHPFQVTEAQFWQVAKYLVQPTEDEGFKIVRHGSNAAPQTQ